MNKQDVVDFLKFFVITLAIVALVRVFVVEPYKVLGQSMVPFFTGVGNERVAIWKIGDYERNDIVVVKPHNEQEKIIKRVIGVPGDRVQLRDEGVIINGEKIKEPYLSEGTPTISVSTDIFLLADNEFFVLGDNRTMSRDSRSIGPILESEIIGRALFQYWPRTEWRLFSRTKD